MVHEINKKGGEVPISKEQQKFNKLKQQIADLRKELAATTAMLDKQRAHYIKHIYPYMQQVTALRTQLVALMNGFMTISKGLSDHEKEDLRQLILLQLEQIFRYQQEDPEGEMLDIFNALSDITYQELTEQYLAKLRKAAATEETDTLPAKTKKERFKEEKERLLEALRKKDLSQLYRQLAKIFHPDLEQDPNRVKEKEELMKRLVLAKEQDDLMTMLQLEMNWIEQEDRHPDQLSADKLLLYNTTLKEQIKDLQAQINALYHHPRYEFLLGFAKSPQSIPFIDWKSEKNNLDNHLYGLQDIINGLSQETKKAIKVLKGVLKYNT